MATQASSLFNYPEVGVPFLWPFSFFIGLEEADLEIARDNLKFLEEVEKTQVEKPKPAWATANKVEFALHTLMLRDFSRLGEKQTPTLILPPYAGHTSVIADFYKDQSLIEALLDNGLQTVYATEWKSANEAMKDYDIDNYLAEVNVCVDDLGKRINLIGLCQGGWLAAMYAARFPDKIATLVLAGSPIDTGAGEGQIKDYAHTFPMSFYEELVQMGGGLLKGEFMLEGFKNMHPDKQYFGKYAELYEHIEEPDYVHRFEQFERWYEYTINLPGRWYLQAIRELFKENRFAKGKFIGLGKELHLQDVKCPVYLLAGVEDDITPKEQVFDAEKYLGTDNKHIVKELAAGGHIGLFMGKTAIRENWPKIARWIKAYSRHVPG